MGALTCSGKCAKYILFLFNLLFWLTGVALIVVGVWMMVQVGYFGGVLGLSLGMIRAASGVVIGVGVFVFIVGGLGCCGAIKENTGCLTCYSVILVLLIILQVVAVILAASFYNTIMKDLTKHMNVTIVSDYGVNNYVTESWDFIQYELECCGVTSPENWQYSDWKLQHHTVVVENVTASANVPDSCCKVKSKYPIDHGTGNIKNLTACQLDGYTQKNDYIYSKGCEQKVDSWIKAYFVPFLCVTVAVILIQILIVVMTCVLKSNIKNAYEYV